MPDKTMPRPYLEQFCPGCAQHGMQVRIVYSKSVYLGCRNPDCGETHTVETTPESHFVCGTTREAWISKSVRRGQIVLYGPGTEQEMGFALTREYNLRGK